MLVWKRIISVEGVAFGNSYFWNNEMCMNDPKQHLFPLRLKSTPTYIRKLTPGIEIVVRLTLHLAVPNTFAFYLCLTMSAEITKSKTVVRPCRNHI